MFRKGSTAYWAIAAFAGVSTFFYVLGPRDSFRLDIVTNAAAITSAAAALAATLTAWRFYDARPAGAWALLTVGICLFFMGELAWGVQEVLLQVPSPFPSIADLFWVLGYFPLFAGLVAALRRTGVGLKPIELVVAIALVALTLGLTTRFLFVQILADDIDPVEKFLDIWYPMADVVILIPALMLSIVWGGSVVGIAWRYVGVGLVLISVADFSFSYLSWHELYGTAVGQPGNYIDLIWMAGYLSVALGGLQFRRMATGR